MKKKNIYVRKLAEIALEDLDLDLHDFIFGLNIEGHEIDDWIKEKDTGNFYWSGENDYLEIDKAIKALQKLKKKGATHVDITPHCDHHGYLFYGNEFREATKEEVQKKHDEEESARELVAKTEIVRMTKAIEGYKKTIERHGRKQVKKG